jgi:glycosyltransferase involved in cell wall biosynthesis
MKIVQFTIRFLPSEGGTERATYYLCKELALNGHNVSVVTTNSYNYSTDRAVLNHYFAKVRTADFCSTEKLDGITIYRYPYLSFRGKNSPIVSLPLITFNTSDFDVVHLQGVNMTSSFALLSTISKLKGKKFVATTHGLAEFSSRPKIEIRYVTEFYLQRAEYIIALCNFEKKVLLHLGVPKEKIVVIPNGVDLNRFKSKPTAEQLQRLKEKYALGKLVVLSIGRIASNKGFERLIEAAVSFKNEDISFVIVGPINDLAYLNTLKSLMAFHGLQKKFILTGWLPDDEVVNLLYAADIFVFPSIIDTFGLVNLDAMAAGKPVIATSTGGVPEVVLHEETGLIVKSNDYIELSKALRRLCSDKALREYMGVRGKELVYKAYSWGKVCRDTINLYQHIH